MLRKEGGVLRVGNEEWERGDVVVVVVCGCDS